MSRTAGYLVLCARWCIWASTAKAPMEVMVYSLIGNCTWLHRAAQLRVRVYEDSFLYRPVPTNFVLLNLVLKKLWSHLWSDHDCQMQLNGHRWVHWGGLGQGNFILGCRRVFVTYLGCFGAWTDAGAGCMRFNNRSHEDFPIRQVVPVGLRCAQNHHWVPWGGGFHDGNNVYY